MAEGSVLKRQAKAAKEDVSEWPAWMREAAVFEGVDRETRKTSRLVENGVPAKIRQKAKAKRQKK